MNGQRGSLWKGAPLVRNGATEHKEKRYAGTLDR